MAVYNFKLHKLIYNLAKSNAYISKHSSHDSCIYHTAQDHDIVQNLLYALL